MAKETPEAEEAAAHFLQSCNDCAKKPSGSRKPDGFVGTGNDVTEGEKSEQAVKHSAVLSFCDCLLLTTIIQVNVVGFWRGLFGILSFIHEISHLSLIFFFGGIVQFQFTVWRNSYKKHLRDDKRSHTVLRKIYVYTSGSAEVLLWAGLWAILEEMSGLDIISPIAFSIICYAILVLLKFSNSLLAPPCCVTTDPPPEEIFEFETAFKTKFRKKVRHERYIFQQRVSESIPSHLRMRRNSNLVKAIEKGRPFLLTVLDTTFSCLVIGPAAIAYWRGTWCLSDEYLFPDDITASLVTSGVIGTLVQVAFTFAQDFLERSLRPEKHKTLHFLVSRLYTYLYGLACINMWRGEWKALDLLCGTDVVRILVPTILSFVVVVCMKTMWNLLSTPFIVSVDRDIGYFQVSTMFGLTKNSELYLYILDCFFSVFVIGSLVVFIWRGVWCLTDVFLFPENEKYSALSSLAIGYAIVIVIFGVQARIQRITDRLTGFWRLLVADIYVFFSFIGTINLWRGIWNLLNLYFLPEFPIWSYWITHLGCFAFLVMIKCSNTILVRGVYLDGDINGKCVVFPTFYFSLFFQKRDRKNQEENEMAKNCVVMNKHSDDVEKGRQQDGPETLGNEKK